MPVFGQVVWRCVLGVCKLLGRPVRLRVCCYRSFGTKDALHVRGRVLLGRGQKAAFGKASRWQNVVAMVRRYTVVAVPHCRLHLQHGGAAPLELESNARGFFYAALPAETLSGRQWEVVQVVLLAAPLPFAGPVRTEALVQVACGNETFGLISDIDDTIIESYATNRLRMARKVFLHNAHTRSMFPGVAAFYRALQQGPEGDAGNPVFYVSSSPWNLHDFLMDFLEVNNIPLGPLMLRHIGFDAMGQHTRRKDHMQHKLLQIERILATYPTLPFVLVGDNGQKDPAIYAEVVARFPGRVLAVYIREVNMKKRNKVVMNAKPWGKDATHVPMVLVQNTLAAAQDAGARGLLSPGSSLK